MRIYSLTEAQDKLSLVDLPYEFSALEPVMDRKTVEYHYKVLSRGYVDRYNTGEGDPEFNRAGAMLHNLWWPMLRTPKVNNLPKGQSRELIEKVHEDWDTFREKFTATAMSLQGSGWCYMAKDGSIKTLKNQTWKSDIVLPIDCWEHAANPYTTRKDYLKTVWRLINWDVVNDRINASQ